MKRGKAARKLARPALINLGLKMVGAALIFAVQVVLARKIDVTGYGRYTYVVILSTGLATVAAMGWPAALMRYVAEYFDRQDFAHIRGVLIKAVQSSMGVAALIASSLVIAGFLVPSMQLEFSYTAAIVPLQVLVMLWGRALRGLHRNVWAVLPEDVLFPFFLVLLALVLDVRGSTTALRLHVFVMLGMAFTAGLVLRGLVPPGASEYASKTWFHSALHMGSAGLAQFVIQRSPLVLLGLVAQPEDLGLYGAAMRFSGLLMLVLAAMNTSMVPLLASSYNNGRINEYKSLLRVGSLIAGLAALPGAVVFMVAPEWCLAFLGPKFPAGANLLRVLALGQFVNAASGPVCAAVIMSRREALFSRMTWTLAVVSVFASLFAIPRWGSLGAAWVSSVGLATVNLASLAIVVMDLGSQEPRTEQTKAEPS